MKSELIKNKNLTIVMGNNPSTSQFREAVRSETDRLLSTITTTFRTACESSLKGQIDHVLERVKAHGVTSQRLIEELKHQRDLVRSKSAILPVETERRLRTDISTMTGPAPSSPSYLTPTSIGNGAIICVLLITIIILSIICHKQRHTIKEFKRQKLVRIRRQSRNSLPDSSSDFPPQLDEKDDLSLKSIRFSTS
ncbi:TPA_asm: hypothetical protein [Metorhabdovirus 1]|nr:TPA_asm: hypothetical protein [Metorhabdovirus 1]